MSELGNLVRRWQRGWTLARGLGEAVEARGALHVQVNDEDRNVEIVVLDAGSVEALAAEVGAHDWITVPTTEPERVLEIFARTGLRLLRPESFMSRALDTHPTHKPPTDYAITTSFDDGVVEARIEHAGQTAARGTMAVVDGYAVAHNIVTSPEHRRRGLASALMSALVDEAAARGATTGILVASLDGERLYTSLGWQRHADVLVGVRT